MRGNNKTSEYLILESYINDYLSSSNDGDDLKNIIDVLEILSDYCSEFYCFSVWRNLKDGLDEIIEKNRQQPV